MGKKLLELFGKIKDEISHESTFYYVMGLNFCCCCVNIIRHPIVVQKRIRLR